MTPVRSFDNSTAPPPAAAPARAEGLLASTLEELLGGLAEAGVDEWIAAALTLGAWRSHQLARELSSQLRIHEPETGEPDVDLPAASLPSYADVVAAGIDAESRGQSGVLLAYRSARGVADACAA